MKPLQKKDILLINCPNWEPRWPNMGLGYISEILRQNQYSLEFLDINRLFLNSADKFEKKYFQPDYWHFWWEYDNFLKLYKIFEERILKIVDKIIDSKNKLIGFSVTKQSVFLSLKIAELLKNRGTGITILFGGYECQFPDECVEKFSDKKVDYIIIDEAEETIIEFMGNFYKNKSVTEIRGVLDLKEPEKYQKRDWIVDLDSLPWPKYEEYDFKIYPDNISMMIMGSRCCSWAKCTICPDTNRGGFFRTRSAENIFEEIKYHYTKNNIKNFVFGDAEINGDKVIIEKLCDFIINSDIEASFGGQLRVDKNADLGFYQKLKKSGFDILLVGLETGSPEILRKINKGFKIEQATEMFKIMKQAGLKVAVNIIVGFPEEKLKHFYETMSFLKRNRNIIDHVEELNSCMVYKKCLIGKNYQKFNIYRNNDEYAWLMKDGNTITERRRRVKVMSAFLDEYKFGRGYKWKKYDENIV